MTDKIGSAVQDVQQEADLQLRPSEAEQMLRRRSLPALLIFEMIREQGEEELNRSTLALMFSGLAAGFSISFSVVAQGAVEALLPADLAGRALIEALAYSVGFLIVIIARQQLFTENTLTAIAPLLSAPAAAMGSCVMRLWAIVLAANLVGTFGFALASLHLPLFDESIRQGMLTVSDGAIGKDAARNFFLGIPAGFLVATLVWMLAAARSHAVALILIMTGLIGLGHLTHVVAGSTEVFLLILAGDRTAEQGLLQYLLPVLAGNVIGGTAIFTLITYAQIAEERQAKAKADG